MNYTGSSCEDYHEGFPETQNKSGYYRMKENNKYQGTYCNISTIQCSSDFISTCAGAGEELLILTSVQEMIVRVSGGRPHNLVLASVEWPCSDNKYTYACSSSSFSTNGISYHRVCGRARGYQKGKTYAFYRTHSSYSRTIDQDYVSGLSIN